MFMPTQGDAVMGAAVGVAVGAPVGELVGAWDDKIAI